jgi:hypothetical protein
VAGGTFPAPNYPWGIPPSPSMRENISATLDLRTDYPMNNLLPDKIDIPREERWPVGAW